MIYIRSTLYFFALLTVTIIVMPMMIVTFWLPFSVRYFFATVWSWLVLWTLKMICGLTYEIIGAENIPRNRNAIVLCKHQSAWETFAVLSIFPKHTFLLKQELLRIPLWGWGLATLEPIAIDRSNKKQSLRVLIKEGTDRLQRGLWLIVFPEGTRTAPGVKTKFNAGGSLLAQKTGVPILPVAHNAGEYWPPKGFLKYPGKITVKIGPLIESANRKATELNKEAEEWMDQAMQEISDPKYLKEYAEQSLT